MKIRDLIQFSDKFHIPSRAFTRNALTQNKEIKRKTNYLIMRKKEVLFIFFLKVTNFCLFRSCRGIKNAFPLSFTTYVSAYVTASTNSYNPTKGQLPIKIKTLNAPLSCSLSK